MNLLSRRDLLRTIALLPTAGLFTRYNALAAPNVNRVKITNVRAMAIRNIAGNCLIRIDTDSDLTGYGEAGATGPMARARIETMKSLLIGKDPLLIEVHFQNMTSLMHTYMAHIPTISGIDIALWDLAGKLLGAPVSTLLGGPFRDAIPMYSHGSPDMLDKASCRDWAQRIKAMPEGFTAFKNGIDPLLGVPAARFAPTLTTQQLRNVARGFANCREAVGDDIDVAVHCHNELDTPSAIAVAKAVEPMNPLFIEDALNPPFSEAWMALRRSTRVPLLTGEKLELVRGFKPFLDSQAVDFVHPDLAFAGGITGTRKIADYAAQFRIPVALHNVGSLVLTYANAHFGASIQNFYRSESQLGRPDHYIEGMSVVTPPEVRKGLLKVPTGPGLGLEINPEFLKRNLADGETYWA
ncbi:MAG TPA: mandelate racemase/muconate lactonizing enzyme family protein [Bryobacteraceae bacterium]|jgi:L-alanine-DL-glutamate epimerase-like enolase superfamily enzyme|nr:mandelate racemase/muconate lactonizing enzyme family protein [Bryobacteraceae bacterium]